MQKSKEFKIIGVSRDDLETAGYDASNVDDATMETIAERMADDFIQNFLETLAINADRFEIPKLTPQADDTSDALGK